MKAVVSKIHGPQHSKVTLIPAHSLSRSTQWPTNMSSTCFAVAVPVCPVVGDTDRAWHTATFPEAKGSHSRWHMRNQAYLETLKS